MEDTMDRFLQYSMEMQTWVRAVAFSQGAFETEEMIIWLRTAGIPPSGGKPYSRKILAEYHHSLRVDGLLVPPPDRTLNKEHWFMDPLLMEKLNQEVYGKPFYLAMAKAADQTLWPYIGQWQPRQFVYKNLVFILQHLQVGDLKGAEIFAQSLADNQRSLKMPYITYLAFPLFRPLLEILLPRFNPEALESLVYWILESLKFAGIRDLMYNPQFFQTLKKLTPAPNYSSKWEDLVVLDQFLGGDIAGIAGTEGLLSPFHRGIQGLCLFLSGLEQEGRRVMDSLMEESPPPGQKTSEGFAVFSLFPFQALWYLTRGWSQLSKFQTWYKKWYPMYVDSALRVRALVRQRGNSEAWFAYTKETSGEPAGVMGMLLDLLAGHALENPLKEEFHRNLLEVHQGFTQRGILWPAVETGFLLEAEGLTGSWQESLGRMREKTGITQPFTSLFSRQGLWEVKLERLRNLGTGGKGSPGIVETADVVCWLLDPQEPSLTPVLRRQSKSGKWTQPKAISLRSLSKRSHPALKPEDLKVLSSLRDTPWGPELVLKDALPSLAGHPRIFLQDLPDHRIDLKARDVSLTTRDKKGEIFLSLSEELNQEGHLELVDKDLYEVLRIPPEVRRVAEVVGSGFSIPREAQQQISEVLGVLALSLPVESPLLKDHQGTKTLISENRLLVQLFPDGTSIGLELHVRPLGSGGPLLRPGEGARQVHQAKEGTIFLTERDLHQEKNLVMEISTRCPVLAEWLSGELFTRIPNPTACLEILAELRDCADLVTLEWPQGKQIKIRSRVHSRNTVLGITHKNDWFELSGTVDLEDESTLTLKDLLDLMPKIHGRFVPMGDEEYLEIEAQLLRQLEQIYRLTDTKTGAVRISPAAILVSGFLQDETAVKASNLKTSEVRQRFREAFEKIYPLPSGFTAELRPYQEEGFQWLSRLAQAGAGACLADDMGLGKTVQTIALLCSLRSDGPSLVIAPASVAPNWISEILKFTTDLEPVLLSPTDRDGRGAQLDSLGPGQVLVTTYGLLVTEEERLQGIHWNVMVLDEAQALKNVQTRRTRSAFGMNARVRVALTGTPMQNHLGELWSLFEVLNPGLLGTKGNFRGKFIQPIEETKDEGAKSALKALLKPFMLRRTKNQVLQDLPSKTEITLSLELNPGERSWYNALHLKALEEMDKLKKKIREGQGAESQVRIQILTWLMKLRRTCCHPSLTGGDSGSPSAKQEKLLELLDEMKENSHRALVFSQFTDHLALIRDRLDSSGLEYEYLDGSTPMKERTLRINRFQTGKAPVFLISLGAGGTGLNLTGADYVIHMDPWWNPAIEDQASDRAHRIGQTRSVTVYRLVAKDTIEDRIMDLHRKKRDLAQALLEGSDGASRVTAQELLEMI